MSNIVGYTTIDQKNTSSRLSNIDLAKRDLLNHFHIRKGEKWTNPEFGSNLPYYVFQPLDESTIEMINEEVFTIISYDPRFQISDQKITVSRKAQTVTVGVKLIYVPTTTATDLQIKFDNDFIEIEEF